VLIAIVSATALGFFALLGWFVDKRTQAWRTTAR